MKKILSLALVMLGLSFSVFAQDAPDKVKRGRKYLGSKETVQKSPEEIAKFRVDKLAKELKLTDIQQKEVYVVQLNLAKKHVKYRAEMDKIRLTQREDMKSSRDQLGDILTADQKEQLKEKFANKEKSDFRRGGEHKRGDRPEFRKERKNIEEKSEMKSDING